MPTHVSTHVPALVLVLGAAACSSHSASGTHTPSPAPAQTLPPSPSAEPTPSVTAAPSATSATSAALPVCAAAALTLSVVQGDSGAGQAHQQLVLTNAKAACTLHGFPGVSFVDAAGHLLGSPAAQQPSPVSRVTLASGGAAAALLTYSNADAYPDSSCRPQQASRVRVYPPGERASLLVADHITVCTVTGSGQLHIGPMQPFRS